MTTRILIVRTSSLGDLVHMLPAISDIARYIPGAQIDWLVEDSFAQIPAWHPAVRSVIRVAHRRWRKAWWSSEVRAERLALELDLRSRCYDIVLDMQSLLKSVFWVRMATGTKHGLSFTSAREPLASFFYDVKHRVKFWQPAVTRQRELAAAAFGYAYEGLPDFGLTAFMQETRFLSEHGKAYAVIMPSASRDDKLWSEHAWQAVFDRLSDEGLQLNILAGNENEMQRAQALIAGRTNALVLPRMELTETARFIAGARVMVGLDSGLTHLSAALGRPTIGIYKASTPVRTPLVGAGFTASLGEKGIAPDAQDVLSALNQALK